MGTVVRGDGQFKVPLSPMRPPLVADRSVIIILCNETIQAVKFFFFFCVPQLDVWGSPFSVRFCIRDRFSNPTIEVVIFRFCGWCMQGVFLLLAFTHLGHEDQNLLSLCDGMHVCTD